MDVIRQKLSAIEDSLDHSSPSVLAQRLLGSVGLRDVIVHQYVDLDRTIVAEAVAKANEGYRQYVTSVARFVTQRRR